MPPKKAATAEAEPKGEEQEPITPEPEEASPIEGEPQEQRGDETPDPLKELTFQQLQEHPRFKEDWEKLTAAQKEERDRAYRDGQSAGAKAYEKEKEKWAAEQQALATFDRLEQKRTSNDPDDLQEFATAMADPKKKEAFDQGQQLRRGPSREQMEAELINVIMGGVDSSLDERLNKHGELTDAEKARIAKDKFKNLGELVNAKVDLLVERGVAAGTKQASEKHDQEVAEAARRDLLDELGIEYSPEEVKGKTPQSDEAKIDAILASPHATAEEKADAFEKKHGYRPRGF